MNLAVNAQDAMPKGGTLTIETSNVDLDQHYARTHLAVIPGSYVALTVTDTGDRHDASGHGSRVRAVLHHQRGRQGHRPRTRDRARHCGAQWRQRRRHTARSAAASSFNVYFPVADAAQRGDDVVAPSAAARALAGETVLVVEDARELRDLTRRLLQRQGYTVLVASNADEALAVFDENTSIDVVLTDVVMPGASGPELTRQLVERRPSMKVIYMSGYTEDAIVHHGVLKSGIAFLHKPFTSDALGRKVREVLDAATESAVLTQSASRVTVTKGSRSLLLRQDSRALRFCDDGGAADSRDAARPARSGPA